MAGSGTNGLIKAHTIKTRSYALDLYRFIKVLGRLITKRFIRVTVYNLAGFI